MAYKHLNELVTALHQLKTEQELKDFLKAILTSKELEEISTRLQVVKLLKQDLPQREIAKKLGVGIATVTRGSKELQKGKFKKLFS